jgi:hypothetical protein
MSELMTFLGQNWELVAALATGLAAWHKDYIMNKIGIRKGKSDADSIHIDNSEQLMKLYRQSVDDLNTLKEVHIDQIKANHKEEITDIRAEHLKNIQDIKDESIRSDKAHKEKFIKLEKDFEKSVKELRGQIVELKEIVKFLTEERDFYKKHAEVELPKKKK